MNTKAIKIDNNNEYIKYLQFVLKAVIKDCDQEVTKPSPIKLSIF